MINHSYLDGHNASEIYNNSITQCYSKQESIQWTPDSEIDRSNQKIISSKK